MVWGAEIQPRSRRIRRAGPWLLALACATVVPLASAGPTTAASTTTVPTAVEAWYLGPGSQPAPVALAPVTGLPAANPYRADTLHVGLAGGNETARTYLKLDPSALPDADLTQGTLVLPLDPGDGTVSAETADLLLCFAPDPGPPVDGSLSTPPPVDCSASTPARYEATPTPRFTADLADLGLETVVRVGGIAVLPSPVAASARETWHVAFHTSKTAPTPADAIHADVVLDDAPASAPIAGEAPDTEVDEVAAVDVEPELDDASDLPLSYTDAPLARLDPPEATAPPALLAQPAAGTAARFLPAAEIDEGFAYSIVLALPLVLLAAFGALASSLSRPPVVVETVVEDHKRARPRSRRAPRPQDEPQL